MLDLELLGDHSAVSNPLWVVVDIESDTTTSVPGIIESTVEIGTDLVVPVAVWAELDVEFTPELLVPFTGPTTLEFEVVITTEQAIAAPIPTSDTVTIIPPNGTATLVMPGGYILTEIVISVAEIFVGVISAELSVRSGAVLIPNGSLDLTKVGNTRINPAMSFADDTPIDITIVGGTAGVGVVRIVPVLGV